MEGFPTVTPLSKVFSEPRLVLHWQTAGRGIADNVLTAQELVSEIDRKLVHPNLVLKLDIIKAYDRVNWCFLMAKEVWFCGAGGGPCLPDSL